MWNIYSLYLKNMFLFHDDDLVIESSFLNVLIEPKYSHIETKKIFKFLNLSNLFKMQLCLDDALFSITGEIDISIGYLTAHTESKVGKNIESEEIKELIDSILFVQKKFGLKKRKTFEAQIDLENVCLDNSLVKSLLKINELGMLRLVDIVFTKSNDDTCFLLTQCSSGELSVLFTFMSIAANIEDDSLILIDEPEANLHPSWQSKFLPLITDVFSSYKNCHFIIATHSPNVVTSIPSENSFVLELSNQEPKFYKGNDIRHRSLDFQMANIFEIPLYGNEYLNRQCINLLSSLSYNGKLNSEEMAIANKLFYFESLIPEGDGVRELISLLKKSLEEIKKHE